MQNKDGQFVQPSEDSFAAAAEHAEWAQTPSMGVILTDMPGEHSWPITAASFILVHQTQADPAQGRATLQFFDWAFEQGSEMARALDYVPDRKSTRLNSSHVATSSAVFCLKKKTTVYL